MTGDLGDRVNPMVSSLFCMGKKYPAARNHCSYKRPIHLISQFPFQDSSNLQTQCKLNLLSSGSPTHSKQPAEFFRTLQIPEDFRSSIVAGFTFDRLIHIFCGPVPSLAMSSCTWRCFNSSWRQREYLTKQQVPLFDVLPER